MAVQYYEGIGRRKESRARVRLMSGNGRFLINDKEAAVYFSRFGDLNDVLSAFGACEQEAAQYDVNVRVMGGGVTGQANAVRLGLARALAMVNPDWTPALRKFGLLTRDARVKERKKPGLKRARKAPTYTKR